MEPVRPPGSPGTDQVLGDDRIRVSAGVSVSSSPLGLRHRRSHSAKAQPAAFVRVRRSSFCADRPCARPVRGTSGSAPSRVDAAATTRPTGSLWSGAADCRPSRHPVRDQPYRSARASAPARHRRPPAGGWRSSDRVPPTKARWRTPARCPSDPTAALPTPACPGFLLRRAARRAQLPLL